MNIDILLIVNTLLILGVALISPGPDFFIILKNSLRFGKRAGIYTGIGIATGCLISFTVVVVGVSLLYKYPIIKQLMNIICGGYLAYIGISCLRSKGGHHAIKEKVLVEVPSAIKLFFAGFFTNVFNPKLYSLTTGIMAYVENSHPSSATNIIIIIGQGGMALIWFTIVAQLFSTKQMQELYLSKESIINNFFIIFFS